MKKALFTVAACILISGSAISQSEVGLSVQAGGFFPIGNFSNIYETGLGGNVALYFKTSRNFEVGISGGYIKYNFNTSGLNKEASEQLGRDIVIKIDAPLTVVPIMLSGRYIFESSKLRPYIVGEIGAHYVSMEFPSFTIGNSVIDLNETESEFFVGFGAGLGILFKLERGIYIDVSGKINGNTLSVNEFQSSDSGDNFTERTATWISAKAGIYFEL